MRDGHKQIDLKDVGVPERRQTLEHVGFLNK